MEYHWTQEYSSRSESVELERKVGKYIELDAVELKHLYWLIKYTFSRDDRWRHVISTQLKR